MPRLQQTVLVKLGLLVFGLVFLSFIVRGFGQFLLGTRQARLVAGPLAVLAALVLVLVLVLWLLGRVGVVEIVGPE